MAAVLSHDAYYGHGRAIRLARWPKFQTGTLTGGRGHLTAAGKSQHGLSLMPAPVRLTDEQMSTIMTAAQPLAPADRGRFLEAVAAGLRGREIGDRLIHRTIAEVQHRFFTRRCLSARRGNRSGRLRGLAIGFIQDAQAYVECAQLLDRHQGSAPRFLFTPHISWFATVRRCSFP